MANIFKPKRSSTLGAVPTTQALSDGELAVNSANKKIYLREGNNIIALDDAGTLNGLSSASFLQSESDTLATVTARGATTSTAVTLSSLSNHYSGHLYYDAYDINGNHYPHFLDGSNGTGTIINWRLFTGATNSIVHYWRTSDTSFANSLRSTVDVRAPIFYDSDNTSYYVNPAGTSILSSIDLRSTSKIQTVGFAGFEYYNTVGGNWEGFIGTENNTGNLRYNSRLGTHTFYNNSSAIVIFNSTGVGISTTNPADTLEVFSANYRGLTLKTTTGSNRPTLSFLNESGGGIAYIQSINKEIAIGRANSDYGGHSETVRFTDSGNIGIGVTNPTSKLHVVGDALITGVTTSVVTYTNELVIDAGTRNNTNDATVYITATNNNDWGLVVNKFNGSATEYGADIRVGDGATYALRILGSTSEKFRVDGNGNIHTVAGVYASNWFRTYNETGLYSQSYGQHFYPDSGGFIWECDGPIRHRDGYDGTIIGTSFYHDAGGKGHLAANGGWWLHQGVGEDGTHLVIGGNTSLNAYNSVTGRRLMFGGGDTDARDNYYIGTNLDNYGGSYNRLDLRWHTGIRMGAQPSYGGIRFYDTEDLLTQIFAIGKDGSYAQANQSMRAPIFYDLDDTAYKLDATSTANDALRIRGGTLHGPNVTWGKYLHVGGDGRNGYIDNADVASVSTTNGNLHIDAASSYYTYLNFYDGSGVYFGNGSSAIVAEIASNGTFRSPVYYDYNDTNYYVDAASTSVLSTLNNLSWVRIGGAAQRSAYGLTVGFTDNTTFASNSDASDSSRIISVINESTTVNAMSVLGFRINPNGNSLNAMMDMKFVNTGATNTSTLHFSFNHGGGFSDRVTFKSDGNVGINSTSPTEKLDVVGVVKATDFNTTSDERLKTNISTIENSLEKVSQIRGVNFEWKDGNRKSAGVIAQEIEKVLPELVRDNGTKTVNYNGLIGVLIEAIKELSAEIDTLKEMRYK